MAFSNVYNALTFKKFILSKNLFLNILFREKEIFILK